MSTVTPKQGTRAIVMDSPDGAPIPVVEGIAFDSEDWVVKAHPEFFETSRRASAVEQATAAPGERRNR